MRARTRQGRAIPVEGSCEASPAGGSAPLAVVFSLQGPDTGGSVQLDLEGTGKIDFAGPRLPGTAFAYHVPGLSRGGPAQPYRST